MKILKKCLTCGAEFIASKMSNKYCCRECERDASRKREAKCKKSVRESEKEAALDKERDAVASRPFLTPSDVALLLDMSVSTVYRCFYSGIIKAVRIRRKTLVRREDLDKYFEDAGPYRKRSYKRKQEQEYYKEKKYSFPLKREEFMLVTSPFGTRKDPLDASKSQLHKGIDIQTNHEAVLATEDKGKVVNVNSNANTNGGRSVTVEYNRNDGSKYQCTYMHLDSISVKIGDEVAAGQKLGISGNTGYRTTGEHLHFGVISISTDGTKRDIDPAAYLAEISQKGNISLQVLSNGKDLTAQYKSASQSDANVQPDTAMSPDEWMKKILSSEDSGVNMPIADPVIEMAMTMFTSLMALALQIDNSSEEEKMQKATAAAVSKSIDLTPILPSYKTCTISLQDGKPNLYADNGVVQLNRELSNAEINKIQQTLGSTMMNDDEKRRSIASVINSAVVTLQMSQNYQNNLEIQQGRQESVQLK